MTSPVSSQPTASLVYGENPGLGEFILLDETTAEALSDEIAAIMDCSTVGEARQLKPTLSHTYLPGSDFEDEEGDPLPDVAPYDWSLTGEAEAGDGPHCRAATATTSSLSSSCRN